MVDLTDNVFHARALAAVQQQLLDEAEQANQDAYDLGVQAASVELNVAFEDLRDEQGARFAERMEFDAIKGSTAEISEELRLTVADARRRGLSTSAIMGEIQQTVNSSKWRASTIARTELNRAANWGKYKSYQQSDVVREKEFVATLDDRVRPSHLAADGERVPKEQPFTRGAASGKLAPPLDPNCRCSIVPVTSLSERDTAREEEVARRLEESDFDLEGNPPSVFLAQENGSAVLRRVPGLRDLEDAHAERMARIWERWTDQYQEFARQVRQTDPREVPA